MLNHSVLQGRIGQDLELKTTANGTEVISFKLAVQRNYNKELTDWIPIVAWKGTATVIAKHFQKGDMICIEGNIQTRDYEDKDGKKVYITEVVAERIHFISDRRKDNTDTADQKKSDDIFDNPIFANGGFMPIGDADDLPFN